MKQTSDVKYSTSNNTCSSKNFGQNLPGGSQEVLFSDKYLTICENIGIRFSKAMFFWKPDTVYVFSIMSYGWGNAIFLLDDESSSKEFSI